jgi:hypothetical protein
MKTLIEITLFSPLVVKTPKREKSYEVQKQSRLLIILHLLVIGSLRLIVVIGRNTSRANTKSSQLGRSQGAIGDIRKLLERLVPLAVNNHLVVPHNLRR